jgi:uncharacterized protein involved in response to NO
MPAFLSRGFRPFFLGAAVLAMVSMAAWLAIYLFDRRYDATGMSPFLWHAHEMLFGYAMAVIGGFLLTAVWNWTGRKTAAGLPLAALFVCWAGARVAMFGSPGGLAWAMFLDTAFLLGLLFALARPVIAVRQFRQAPVLVILLWLVAARVAAGLGAMGEVPGGGRMGIYAALYGVLALVMFMGRRVLPFFIQRGVGYEVELRNDAWNDRATIALFPAFALSELLLPNHFLGALLAAALFVLNTLRVMGWHNIGIWQRPLLWSLFMAFLMINLGFMMRALMLVTGIPVLLPIHAFALGGIGLMTLGMMIRVTLGHTGRNVHAATPVVTLLVSALLASTILRIFMPLVDPNQFWLWIGAAGGIWIATFALFILVFGPMLVTPRADEEPGKP